MAGGHYTGGSDFFFVFIFFPFPFPAGFILIVNTSQFSLPFIVQGMFFFF